MALLEIADNENLCHIGRNVFDNLFSLSSLILSNNNFTTLEVDLITRFKKSADLFLDVRGNPFNCNCSLEWLNFHFIRMFNKTISSNPEYFGKNYSYIMFNMDGLLNNNYSDLIIRENAMKVKCSTPFALQNKLVIKLHKDKFGCFVIESIIPIIIGALFGIVIIIGVIVLSIIRCKYQLSGFVKNQLYAENNQMDLYHKPEFLFVPSGEYNTMYKDNKLEDLTARYPLRTPITELWAVIFIHIHNCTWASRLCDMYPFAIVVDVPSRCYLPRIGITCVVLYYFLYILPLLDHFIYCSFTWIFCNFVIILYSWCFYPLKWFW